MERGDAERCVIIPELHMSYWISLNFLVPSNSITPHFNFLTHEKEETLENWVYFMLNSIRQI